MNQAASSSTREVLRVWHENDVPSALEFIEDLPYALQGLNTPRFRYSGSSLEIKAPISFPESKLLRTILEPGLIYRDIQARLAVQGPGLIFQALERAIESELHVYLLLVGQLEKRIKARLPDINYQSCIDLLSDVTLVLRFLHKILTSKSPVVGSPPSQMLNVLHNFTQHGDLMVSKLAQQIIEKASVPFNQMLESWISIGVIDDPYNEFFVEARTDEPVWENKFVFHSERVPIFITDADSRRAYELGKSVYFLRSIAGHRNFSALSEANHAGISNVLKSYDYVVQHLNERLADGFGLHEHLRALRNFLLLANAEFGDALVDAAKPTLEHSADGLYRHELISILDSAIASSTARFSPPEVLDRLDARLLDLGHGERGWQVFTLEYKLQSPLDKIIGYRATRKYLQVFNLLWNLKWAHSAVFRAWERLVPTKRGARGDAIDSQGISGAWRSCSATCYQMVEFLGELKRYIYMDVIEHAWNIMHTKLTSEPRTIDEIIQIHDEYLADIVKRALFGGGAVMHSLHSIVGMVLKFQRLVEDVYFITLHHQVQAEAEAGRLETLLGFLETIQREFDAEMRNLLSQLRDLDDDEQTFGARVNFNRYYFTDE